MPRNPKLDCSTEPEALALAMTRRELLAAVGGGILVSIVAPEADAQQREGGPRAQAALPYDAHLRVGADGRVTCFVGKIEMGQGAYTSLAQVLAEELEVPLSSVDMVMGDTDLCPYDMGTWGSMTIRVYSLQLKQAAAEARAALLELGAEKLETPVADLVAADGAVYRKADPTQRVTYASLAQGKAIRRKVTGVSPQAVSEHTVVGKPVARLDGRPKVTGAAKYTGDLRLPGMLYARVLRPPSHGATLKSVDTSAAAAMPGVTVVNQDGLVAVLHERFDLAGRALGLVKATWDEPKAAVDQTSIHDHLQRTLGEPGEVASGGSLADGEKQSEVLLETTYLGGYLAHAPIETHTALAQMKDGRMTVWASTQSPFGLKREVAGVLGVNQDQVRVITPFVGAGFGGKSTSGQGVEAARLARITGKPVMVVWTRDEEFFLDHFRPAAVHKIRAGMTKDGKLVLWDLTAWGPGRRGIQHPYDVANYRIRSADDQGNPLATGPWRGPGSNANHFARESHMDALAAKAGIDPVEFRLNHLKGNNRTRRVLETAAQRFGWKPAPAPSKRGLGVAVGDDAGTVVAEIAEVKVDRDTGVVKVTRVLCAQEMGLVVNPEGATAQVESCINMGLGYILSEELRFQGGNVLDRQFTTYRIPTFQDVPSRIDTVLVDAHDSPPQGGGEPAIVCLGAAVSNAVFDATGVRMTQLPLTTERVLAGLKRAAA